MLDDTLRQSNTRSILVKEVRNKLQVHGIYSTVNNTEN